MENRHWGKTPPDLLFNREGVGSRRVEGLGHSPKVLFLHLGERPAEQISEGETLLGIGATPQQAVEDSHEVASKDEACHSP